MTEKQLSPQEFAAKVDAEVAAKREAKRLEAMGVKPPKTSWTEDDHEATRQRVAAAEERKAAAAKMPDARGLTDAQFEAELRRQGINTFKPIGS